MSLSGKVVAITGTTAGIGRTVAEVFAERGALVVGCGRRTEKGEAVAQRIRVHGGAFTFITADLTVRDDCIRFVDAVVEQHGKIDVLINNAGGNGAFSPADNLDESRFDATLRLNLHGSLFCSQRAIHHMKSARQGGVILSVASVQAVQAVAGSVGYNTAKAGLIALSNTLAVEFLADGIRSNVILMGGAPTAASAGAVRDITKALNGADAEPDFTQYLPRPLTGTPLRDIGAALALLADDDAKAITGAAIAIDQAQSAGSLYSDAIFHALSGRWSAENREEGEFG